MGKIAKWNDIPGYESNTSNKCPTFTEVVKSNQNKGWITENSSSRAQNQCIQESTISWRHDASQLSGKMHDGKRKDLCIICGTCQDILESCPISLFYFKNGVPYMQNDTECIECGACYNTDPGFFGVCPGSNGGYDEDDIFWVDNASGTMIITV